MTNRYPCFLPKEITRKDYVELIFEIGYEYSYETIYTAVELGDKFVEHEQSSIPQIYSTELAYVVLSLVAKAKEDFNFYCTKTALRETKNSFLINMEWKIGEMFGFCFNSKNFLTLASSLVCCDKLYSGFFDLTKEVCMNKKLMKTNPRTLLCGILLLIKKRKLKAPKLHRWRLFSSLLMKASYEYEIPLKDLIDGFKSR